MILALAFCAIFQDGNPVTVCVDPAAAFVSVDAIVKLPHLSGHEYAEVELIAETMSDNVEGFSLADMRDSAARVGENLKITLMPDNLRIQFGVPPGDLKTAITYVDQILRNASFQEDPLNKAISEIPFRSKSLWATAIQPGILEFHRVRKDEIVDLYHRICRPENVWLSVGGPVNTDVVTEIWTTLNESWAPGRAAKPSLDQAPLREAKQVPGRVSMIELRGKEILGGDASLPARLLATIALGSGKGSAMFARLRELKGWSYRQEAILWPTPDGFVPRMIMASGDKTSAGELALGMKSELGEAVKGWSDADLARAEGMAEGIFSRGLEMSPLYFNPYWPITNSLDDRTFLAGYWRMKTGKPWDDKKMLATMALVSLAELKEAAMEILNGSHAHVIFALS